MLAALATGGMPGKGAVARVDRWWRWWCGTGVGLGVTAAADVGTDACKDSARSVCPRPAQAAAAKAMTVPKHAQLIASRCQRVMRRVACVTTLRTPAEPPRHPT